MTPAPGALGIEAPGKGKVVRLTETGLALLVLAGFVNISLFLAYAYTRDFTYLRFEVAPVSL